MSEPFGPAGWGPGEVAIDESAPPPRRDRGPWMRVGVVAGLLAAAGVVVAVTSGGSSGDTTSAGSTSSTSPVTTAPRAISTAAPTTTEVVVRGVSESPFVDLRAVIVDPPPGYVGTAAEPGLLRRGVTSDQTGFEVFAAAGTTWSTGPWVTLDSATEHVEFVGPPTTVTVGEWGALSGHSTIGDETVLVTTPAGAFAVSTKGLAQGTALELAATVTVGGRIDRPFLAIPAGALPPGLERLDTTSASYWAFGARGRDVAWTQYYAEDGGLMVLLSRPSTGSDALGDARYFLDGVHYLYVDGVPAIAGRWNLAADTVVWQRDGRVLQLTSIGPDLDQQLRAAASVVVAGEPGFDDDRWQRAVGGRDRPEVDQATIATDVPAGPVRGTIWATESGGWLTWWLSSRDVHVAESVLLAGAPTLRIGVEPLSPDRLDEGFTVVAIALGDPTLAGSTLRLRAGDEQTFNLAESSPGEIIDAAAFAGRWAAGTSVAWTTGGIVAELIAPDGVTVLASATEADLP